MKKLLFLLVCLFTMQTVVRADDDKPIEVSQMPQIAQTFIKQHFADRKIALSKMESVFFQKSYEVIFTDGDKVDFDKKGNWTEVNCKHSSVPVAVIPAPILTYVKKTYADTKVLKIERDDKDYEVALSNRMELKFDTQFKLIDIEK